MTRRTWIASLLTSPLVVIGAAFVVLGAGEASVPNTFVAGTPAQAAQVNANFAALRDRITANVPWRSRIDYNTKLADNSVTSTWEILRTAGTFTKQRSDTDVILTLDTQLTVNGNDGHLQLRIDDATDGPANGGAFARHPTGTPPFVDCVTLRGVFQGVPAGVHTVSIWVRTVNGASAITENDDQTDRTLYIEESPSR